MSADLLAEFGFGDQVEERVLHQATSGDGALIPGFEASQVNAHSDIGFRSHGGISTHLKGVAGERKSTADVDILFDATVEQTSEDGNDDDFGEFETGIDEMNQSLPSQTESGGATKSVTPCTNLWEVDLLSPPVATPQVSETETETSKNTERISSKPSQVVSTKTVAFGDIDDDWGDLRTTDEPAREQAHDELDEWGDFTDAPTSEPAIQSRIVEASHSTSTGNYGPTLGSAPDHTGAELDDWSFPDDSNANSSTVKVLSTTTETTEIRPTNIPPPSTLLQLLPTIFDTLHINLNTSRPTEIAAQILVLFTTTVHLIAGRSLRWKRDTRLAQSIRIGPSSNSGGMKLAAISRSENIKEERDVAEVLSAWEKKAHLFSSPLQRSGKVLVLILRKDMRARPIGAAEGGLTAPHPCALCGLKREERVQSVDLNVNDSFGEWWSLHWGHVACRAFWERHRGLLNQR